MQIQKENIKRQILDTARKEFLEKNFQKASMRTIAELAGVSTSNVYNYFKNKDDLFHAIVKPTIDQIIFCFGEVESSEPYKDPVHWSFESHLNQIEIITEFIDTHRLVLKLLVFQSHGSSFENFKDELIERYTKLSLNYLKKSQSIYPGIKTNISEFCVHNIASLMFNIATEVLMHDTSKEEMLSLFKEMLNFMFYGYEGLMEYNFETMTPKVRKI